MKWPGGSVSVLPVIRPLAVGSFLNGGKERQSCRIWIRSSPDHCSHTQGRVRTMQKEIAMNGKMVAALATSLVCLTCGCVTRSERMPHKSVQQKRAGRNIDAVAALLKTQGRHAEAARLQQQCRPQGVLAESAEQTSDSLPTVPNEHAQQIEGEQTPDRVPPVPQPAPPPEPVEPTAASRATPASTDAQSNRPPAASTARKVTEETTAAFDPH